MITCRTLTDGGQTAVDVAREVAAFLDARPAQPRAGRLRPRPLGRERRDRARRSAEGARSGVEVRLVYNVNHPNPIPVPPPPTVVPEDVAALPVESLAVSGIPDLMHHKFVVRDGTAVLTGSTNWTDDSWTRQENVMVSVESAALGEAYALAFDALWTRPGDRGGPGRAAPRRRRRHRRAAVVLPGVRRRALAPGGEGDRAGEAPRSHLLAGHLGRACAGDARAGRGRGPRRRRRLRGRDAARVRAPAVDGDEGVGLEDPAARDDPRAGAVLRQELDALGARAASTTSCTRR